MQKKVDVVKLASATTWQPVTSPVKDLKLHAYDQTEINEQEDKIDLIFTPTKWQNKETNQIYVGVYTADSVNEPVDFTVRMREYTPQDTYSESLKVQNTVFETALEGTDAHAVSF